MTKVLEIMHGFHRPFTFICSMRSLRLDRHWKPNRVFFDWNSFNSAETHYLLLNEEMTREAGVDNLGKLEMALVNDKLECSNLKEIFSPCRPGKEKLMLSKFN